MALSEQERQELLAWKQQNAPVSAPSGVSHAPLGTPQVLPYPASFSKNGLRMNFPPPSGVTQAKQSAEEDSATRRQLLKKAADQKLQLEQAIGLFDKIYQESETDVPVITHPEGTLPFQQLGRFAGQKLGLREKQRGTLTSLQARATPALKSLGEVGVLTNQDIERMLKGGFPADDDTAVSRQAKREGIITDLQMKLDQVNAVLGQSGTRQADRPAPESDPLGLR